MTTFYLVRHADTGVRGYRAEKACWKFKTDLSAGWKPYAPGETDSRFVTAVDQRPVEHRKHLFGSSNGIRSHWRQRKCHIEDF